MRLREAPGAQVHDAWGRQQQRPGEAGKNCNR